VRLAGDLAQVAGLGEGGVDDVLSADHFRKASNHCSRPAAAASAWRVMRPIFMAYCMAYCMVKPEKR
jgi:hypothetical protein